MSLTAALNWKPFCLHPLQWVICTTFIKASFTCLWCIYCHIIKVQIIICQVKGQCFQAFIVDMVSVSFSMISRKHFIIWRLNWLILTWKVMIQCVSLAQQICSSAMSLAGGCGTELKAFLSTPPAMSNSYNLHEGPFHLLMMYVVHRHTIKVQMMICMSGQRSLHLLLIWSLSLSGWYYAATFNNITNIRYYQYQTYMQLYRFFNCKKTACIFVSISYSPRIYWGVALPAKIVLISFDGPT